jgi:hypothetical protein
VQKQHVSSPFMRDLSAKSRVFDTLFAHKRACLVGKVPAMLSDGCQALSFQLPAMAWDPTLAPEPSEYENGLGLGW